MFVKDCCLVLLCLCALNLLSPVLGQEGSGTTTSPFEDCTGYPTLANSNAFTGEITHGSVLTVICNSGYINTGAEQYICNNGEWEPNGNGGEPYCAIQCAVPSLANGQTNLTDNGCSYENCTIVFTCDTGYNLNGQQNLTCQASGSWGVIPTCQIVDCGAPTISNGTYSGSTTYGSEVTFQCTSSSYFIAGPASAVCGANGNWSELPSCIYSCGAFPNISNAALTFNCSGQQLEGCSVLVRCGIGYNLTGNSSVTCFAGQGWGFRPSCIVSTSGVSYNVSVTVIAPPPQRRVAFEAAIQIELLRYYTQQMGNNNVITVVIIRIRYVPANTRAGRRKRQDNTGEVAIVDYTVAVADTPEAKGELSTAQAGLVTTRSLQVDGQTLVPLETSFSSVTLQRTNGSDAAVKQASCQIYTQTYGACASGTECHVYGNGDYTSCIPVSQPDDDFGLKVGLGVGIPLFLLTCALIGVIAYYVYTSKRRSKRMWRRRQHDFDDSDSAIKSGFSPLAVPARLNPNGRRGPLYGSNMSDGWNDAASLDSDRGPRDKYDEPYFVPVGYQSGHSKLASNYSWDFMYPHLDDRFAMPRPRI